MEIEMGTLASKLAKASLIVGGSLSKDKTNTQDRYSYVSADQILTAAGQALAECGVTIFPSVTHTDIVVFDRGQGKNRYDAQVQFVFIIADDESQMEVIWPGYGSDYTVPDKAIYKAITSGHKYFLAKLLNIGAGNEDGEHDSGNSTSLAGRVNESDKTCRLCSAPPGKIHTQKCTATEAPPPVPAPAKPASKPTEPPPSRRSLDDVEELPFDEESDASREWDELPSVPAGQPSSAGAKVQRPDWNNPNEAKEWAVKVGACKNEFEARASLKKVVDGMGGKLNAQNMDAVMDAFHARQLEKLAEAQAEAVPA